MGYSYQGIKDRSAKAFGRSLSISPRHSIEICCAVRGKRLVKAKEFLQRVIIMKQPVPFKYFTEVGHRSGKLTSGRFPVNASRAILGLLESAEANASQKGMNVDDLIVKHISAQKAPTQWHYGRLFRRKMKRANIEVVLEENKNKSTKTQKNMHHGKSAKKIAAAKAPAKVEKND